MEGVSVTDSPSIIMQGTSPFAYQSPSFHSSSYLPKLEANFMRDFACCNIILPGMHELLQHYEENHAGQMPGALTKHNQSQGPPPDPKAAIAAGAAAALRDPSRAQKPKPAAPDRSHTPVQSRRAQQLAQQTIQGFAPPSTPISEDEDAVGDMELDDGFAPNMNSPYTQPRLMQQSQFGRPNRVPPLDMHALNVASMQQQHQGLRHSTPTTPVTAGRNGSLYQHNPTVSSVNTPTLSTNPSNHPLQQQYYTPESSAPGTPGELDGDFVGNMSTMNVGGHMGYLQNQGFGHYGFGNGHEFLDLCIDEPAKRLWSPNGAFANPPPPTTSSAAQLGDGQYSENSDLARTIREQQKLAGVPDPSADGGVPKPFHCPVIGCEKAYKNHNGLKYHKSVSLPSSFHPFSLAPCLPSQ